MIAEKDLPEYLSEIREHVCTRCVERPPNGPPCAPLGKDCGIELHLPQLIESIRAVHSPMLAPYLEHNRHEVCEKCALLHSSICPCPMDYLSAQIVEAVEAVDKRQENSKKDRDFLASRSEWKAVDIDEVRRAYEEARGTWMGCDWPTRFGSCDLDLNGLTPAHAEKLAAQTTGTPAGTDWRAAVSWLAQVQHQAEQAEVEAAIALRSAEDGDWQKAVRFAQRALFREFATGRAIRNPLPPTWQRLHEALKDRESYEAAFCEEFQAQD